MKFQHKESEATNKTDYIPNPIMQAIPYSQYNQSRGYNCNLNNLRNKIIFLEDVTKEALTKTVKRREVLMNAVTYIGRNKKSENAREIYAITIDLDNVTIDGLVQLLYRCYYDKQFPIPTILVNSGTGFHLYYVLDKPVALTKNNSSLLKKLQYALTETLWKPYITEAPFECASKLSVTQGYRAIGCLTKFGRVVRGYRMDAPYYTLQQLAEFLDEDKKLQKNEFKSLGKMEEKFVYSNNYVVREVKRHIDYKNYGFYNFCFEHLKNKTPIVGKRYFNFIGLVSAAVKNKYPKELLKKDLEELWNIYIEETTTHSFPKKVINDALKIYDLENTKKYTKRHLEKLLQIKFGEPNKRNGREQKDHLKLARKIKNKKRQSKVKDKEYNKKRKKQLKSSIKRTIKELSIKAPVEQLAKKASEYYGEEITKNQMYYYTQELREKKKIREQKHRNSQVSSCVYMFHKRNRRYIKLFELCKILNIKQYEGSRKYKSLMDLHNQKVSKYFDSREDRMSLKESFKSTVTQQYVKEDLEKKMREDLNNVRKELKRLSQEEVPIIDESPPIFSFFDDCLNTVTFIDNITIPSEEYSELDDIFI